MTDTTSAAPSDAELQAFAVEVDRADAVNLARNCLGAYGCAITKKGVRVLAEAVLSMDAALSTPRPNQAQAGAVPLTNEQLDAALGNAKKVKPGYVGWVTDQRREWGRAVERAHGIGAEKGDGDGLPT